MKIKKYIMLFSVSFAVACLTGCLSDDGNYNYTELDDVEISGVPESARFILQTPQTISPIIVTNTNESDLEYCWRISSDTLCKTREFNYTFTEVPVRNELTFDVRNKRTDVRYSKVVKATVVSPFTSGWLVLTDYEGKSKLAFQSLEDQKTLFQDVYKYVNGTEMNGQPVMVKQIRYQDGNTGAWVDRVSVLNKGGKSPELDGVSMIHTYNYEDQFKNGNVPQPAYISSEYYRFDYTTAIIGADGSMYGKANGSGSDSKDGYFVAPYVEDGLGYEMAPALARLNGQCFGYDRKNHRFVQFTQSYLSTPITAPVYGTSAVSTDVFPGELVWMGATLFEYDNFYAVLKNNGKYYLYSFSYGYDNATYSFNTKVLSCEELPDGTVSDNSKFQIRNDKNYLFVSNGNVLKAINMSTCGTGNVAVEDIATFGGAILDMQYCIDSTMKLNEFGVAIDGGDGTTSLLIIDPTLTSHGAILQRFDGINGKAVSIWRKY